MVDCATMMETCPKTSAIVSPSLNLISTSLYDDSRADARESRDTVLKMERLFAAADFTSRFDNSDSFGTVQDRKPNFLAGKYT